MPMNFPTRPELAVEIAFVDTPLSDDVDGTAQTSVQTGTAASTGWTDITDKVRSVSINRGRSNDLEKVSTGTATVVLDNRDRRFDPVNEAGLYWDNGSIVNATNFIKNPSFEFGIGNWFTTGCTTAWNSALSVSGGYSLQLTASGTSVALFASNANSADGSSTTRTTVQPSQQYFLSGSFINPARFTTSTHVYRAGVRYYNAAGSVIQTSASNLAWTFGAGYTFVSHFSTAPIGAVTAVPYFEINATASGRVFHLDAVIFTTATGSVVPFFDGGFAGCRWQGTPGDSVSEQLDGLVNLKVNPSFEHGVLDWAQSGGVGNLELSGERAFDGSFALKYTQLSSNPSFGFPSFSCPSAMPVVGGQTYYISAMVLSVNRQITIRTEAAMYNDFASFLPPRQDVVCPAGVWTRVGVTFTTPLSGTEFGVDYGDLYLNVQTQILNGDVLYIDAISISLSPDTTYIDGDKSSYEYQGGVSSSASQQIVRPAGTLLKPRRQIQIHGVFPNNAVNDQQCYDLVSGVALSPGSGSVFTRAGLRQVFTATTFSNTGFLPATDRIRVKSLIKPDMVKWSALDAVIWELPNRVSCSVSNNTLWLYYRISGTWTLIWSNTLPVDSGFNDSDAMWLQVDIQRLPIGMTDFRYRINVGYTAFQTPVPEVFTAFGTEVTTVASSLTPTLQSDQVRFGGSNGLRPLSSPTNNNVFQLGRFAIDDVTNDDRVCDLMADTYHTIFRGYTTGWKQQYDMTGKDATVPLECFDGLGIIGSMQMPSDFVTEFARSNNAWGYWKLGDAGGVAVDYSGQSNDLLYKDGGRLPSTYGSLAAGLSGLPSEFKRSTGSTSYGYLIANDSGGDRYPVRTGMDAIEYTVSFWMRSAFDATSTDRMPLFVMTNPASFSSPTTSAFLEIGIIPLSVPTPRSGWMYARSTSVATGVSTVVSVGVPSFPGPRFVYPDDQEPHHLCVTMLRTGATTFRYCLYQDGVYLGQTGDLSDRGVGGIFSIGGRYDTVSGIQQFSGDIQDVMFIPGKALSQNEVKELYDLSLGYIQESTKQRAERLLDFTEFPNYLRAIDTDMYGECGAIANEEEQSILEAMNLVEDTEAGVLFVDRTGRFAMRGRYFLSMNDLGVTTQAAFDDANVGIGYTNLEFNLDADQLANDTTVVDDAEQENQATDDVSIVQYGRRSRTINTLLPSSEDAHQMAIGLTNIYKEPILRAEPFRVVPTFDQWLKILPLDLGVRMSLEATPMGVGAPIQQELALQAISYDIREKDWSVTIVGSPRPVISYFVLDRSELDGPDVLGF